MRISPYVAVLDTCVLAPMPVVDTLLRLAQEPAFYVPKWSDDILQELCTTLKEKFGCSQAQVDWRLSGMAEAFPEALVTGYDAIIPSMTNDPKDRHVLAAVVKWWSQCHCK
ncbi:MAG TPA: hypothetical protein VG675_12365 [Bryobacteraceae bacterium]|nr:hypothetical protein [Bryobacteraceae bacterium]